MASKRVRGVLSVSTQRQAQAWELRKAGGSYRAIGQQLGISHVQAQRDCETVLRELQQQSLGLADEWRTLQLQRCEDMILGLWARARGGDTEAIGATVKVMRHQADLLGLDAPKRIETSGIDGGPIEIDERITVSQAERDERILAIIDAARARLDRPALDAQFSVVASDRATDSSVA